MRKSEMKKEMVLGPNYGQYSGQKLYELLSEEALKQRVREIGKQISKDYSDKTPVFIGVLNGSFIFFSDLLREIDIDGEVDFIKIWSYADETKTSGSVKLIKDVSCNISGRDVIVVEDIVDSGISMKYLRNRFEDSNARSVRFVALLIKESTKIDFTLDYIGFTIPDKFVVGYGLDLAQKLRNLKSIYAFK